MAAMPLPLGPVMADIRGKALLPEEHRRLLDPHVGGIILFARNYESPTQLTALCQELHALREPQLLIAVDQEGGRVQRFRDGFSRIPAMATLGQLHDRDAALALQSALACGKLIAAELRSCGVDLSFAPVLDLDYGISSVIGDRAFHADPEVVSALAGAFLTGLAASGMRAVGKHFPGHGGVRADSHQSMPIDDRAAETIFKCDMVPFRSLAAKLGGIMPAHVVYSACDQWPAGYSKFWLQDQLRHRIGFRGAVFSDDLCMEGAAVVGGTRERAEAALHAGCDVVLVCNNPEAVDELLAGWRPALAAETTRRIEALRPAHILLPDQAELESCLRLVADIPIAESRGAGGAD